MLIDKLIPTHNELRHPEHMWEIYKSWINNPKQLAINTTNKKYYIQDGHHRLVLSYWLDWRTLAFDKEFVRLTKYSIKEYKEISFKNEWVTPFHLDEEVRVADFGKFKDVALKVRNEQWIRNNKWLYTEYRYVPTLVQLANKYAPVVYISEKPTTESEKSLALPEAEVYAYIKLKNTNFTLGGVCSVNKVTVKSCRSEWNNKTQIAMLQAEIFVKGL